MTAVDELVDYLTENKAEIEDCLDAWAWDSNADKPGMLLEFLDGLPGKESLVQSARYGRHIPACQKETGYECNCDRDPKTLLPLY